MNSSNIKAIVETNYKPQYNEGIIHERYINQLSGSLTGNTKKAYLNDIKQFYGINDFTRLTLEQIKDVNVSTANQYFEKLTLQGYAPSTINRKMQALSKFYKFLCRKEIGIMDYDPFSSEQGSFRLKAKNYGNTRALTDDEIKRPLAVISKDVSIVGIRNTIIILLLATTGVRREEAASIKLRHISSYNGKTVIEINGKGRKERIILIADYIKQLIDEYLKLRSVSIDDKDLPLFTSHSSNAEDATKPLSANAIYKMVKTVASKAGLEVDSISPHCFRHTYITKSLEMGCRIEDVQDRAGHSDISTTRRYDHTHRIMTNNPADKMAESLCSMI